MAGAFHFEGRLFRMIEKGINLIKLNIIWILFSLPLVTGGAALCALHVTAVRILKDEEGYILRDFWTVFRSKFKITLKIRAFGEVLKTGDKALETLCFQGFPRF